MTLCPDDFSKSGISAMNPGCKATADRSLISAAFAVLPAVMAKKASPNAIVAETLRMLRRFIVFSSDHRLRDAGCQRAHTWNAGAEAAHLRHCLTREGRLTDSRATARRRQRDRRHPARRCKLLGQGPRVIAASQ